MFTGLGKERFRAKLLEHMANLFQDVVACEQHRVDDRDSFKCVSCACPARAPSVSLSSVCLISKDMRCACLSYYIGNALLWLCRGRVTVGRGLRSPVIAWRIQGGGDTAGGVGILYDDSYLEILKPVKRPTIFPGPRTNRWREFT